MESRRERPGLESKDRTYEQTEANALRECPLEPEVSFN